MTVDQLISKLVWARSCAPDAEVTVTFPDGVEATFTGAALQGGRIVLETGPAKDQGG